MKLILIITTFVITLFACTGDCMTCHPSLSENIEKDLRHKPMLGCIKCHKADPESMSECGSDCYACHSIEKLNKPNVREHDVIIECRDCHMKMNEEILNLKGIKTQSIQEPLKEFLFK